MNKLRGLTPLAKFMYVTKVATFWRNGDGFAFLWNWWNPLAWVLAPLTILITIVLFGLADWDSKAWSDLGFTMDPYWVERKAEREFL